MAHRNIPDEAGYPEAEKKLAEAQVLIGQTVMVWADLEDKLIALLAKLAECPPYTAGIIFYTQNSLRHQISTIRKLADLNTSNADERKTITDALDRLGKLATTRNKFVHSVYSICYEPSKKKPKFEVTSRGFQSTTLDLMKRDKVNISAMRDHVQLVGLMNHQIKFLVEEFENKNSPAQQLRALQAGQKAKTEAALKALRDENEPD